jgi:hypothetical protein
LIYWVKSTQFACVSTNTDAEAQSYARKEAERKSAEAAEDFTCFTGAKVQMLTLNVYRRGRRRRGNELKRRRSSGSERRRKRSARSSR